MKRKYEIGRTEDGIIINVFDVTAGYANDLAFSFSFFHNGHEWMFNKNYFDADEFEDADQVADRVKSHADYDSCITEPGRQRPAKRIRDAVIASVKSYISDNAEEFAFKLQEIYNDNITNDCDNEVERLKAELEAAKKAAEAHDINQIIMNSVVEAVTPQIVERIKERVGGLVDCLPTRLEVKIKDKEIDAGEAVRHEKFETVLNLVANGLPVWLVGESGTGKSVLCEQVADAIGAEYRYSGAILDEFTGLKGFIDANGAKHGTQFTEALDIARSGRDVVFCMDECDGSTPEVLLVLNNLLSGGAVECMGECYRMNEYLHIIACGNTNGRGGSTAYTRSIIDSATLDRFFMVEIDYSEAIDLAAANGDEDLFDFVRQVRKSAKECAVDMLVTYRAASRLAKMKDSGIPLGELLHGAVFRGIDDADIRMLVGNMAGKRGGTSDNEWFAAMKGMVL